jgi:hypothetical protein
MVPRDADLWRFVLDHRLLDVHTCMPAEVKSFDATAQTATLQPLIKHVVIGIDGTEIIESYPELRAVPVLYPRAGGYVIAWPLSVGDPVLVLFSEWAIGNYREKGREDHPILIDRHGLSGAVALPIGPYKASDTISETIDALMIGYDGGAVIRIADDGTIRIGATAGDVQPAALAENVTDALQAIVDAIKGGVPTPQDGGAGLQATIVAALPDPVSGLGSTKVEVEE